jgi:ABC-type Fe3+-hydroxamate transport system substrate-binding protein
VIFIANQYARQWQTKQSEPGWRDLDAVQTGRVYFIDSDEFHRPGPGVVANVRQLASFLHDGGN